MPSKIVYEKTGEVEEIEIAKLFDYEDFLYTTVAVLRPLRLWFEGISEKWDAMCADDKFNPDDKKNAILKEVAAVDGIDQRRSDYDFFRYLKDHKVKFTAAQVKQLRQAYGVTAEDAPEAYEKPLDKDSGYAIDTSLNDTEKIPFKQDIDEYFAREVTPFTPDAWMDRSKDKVGCEFPFTRVFYIYRPLRSASDILADLQALDRESDAELSTLISEEA